MVGHQQPADCSQVGLPVLVDGEEARCRPGHGETQRLEDVEVGPLSDELVELVQPFLKSAQFSCGVQSEICTPGQGDPSVGLDLKCTFAGGIGKERLGQGLAFHGLLKGAVSEVGGSEL